MSTHRSLHLSSDQRQHLQELIGCGAAQARTQTKARILLLSDSGNQQRRTYAEIGSALLCSVGMVNDTRRRFLEEGLKAALYDRPRSGRKPKLDGAGEAKLVLLACSEPPPGQGRWTLQLMADELVATGVVESFSAVAVHKRLKKTILSRGK